MSHPLTISDIEHKMSKNWMIYHILTHTLIVKHKMNCRNLYEAKPKRNTIRDWIWQTKPVYTVRGMILQLL